MLRPRNTLKLNAVANIAGSVVPLFVAVVTIPQLVRGLGDVRFGILAIAWVFLGYFSAFDLGIGTALTRSIAEQLKSSNNSRLGVTIATGNIAIVGFGFIASITLLGAANLLAFRVLNIPSAFQLQVWKCLMLIAVGLPFVCSAGGLRGTLEAYQRFDIVNAIRIPASVLNFVAPLAALWLHDSLIAVVLALLGARFLTWALFAAAVRRVTKHGIFRFDYVRWRELKALLRFGSWMTVSNVIGPLMVYMDRLVIGAMSTVSSVTYYVSSFELITKALLVPGAITAAVFPALVPADCEKPETANSTALLLRAQGAIFLATFPVVVLAATFANELLALWINPHIAANSSRTLQILALGVLFNGTAFVKSAYLQASGRPDITAKMHMGELPVYFAALWIGTTGFGIEGAAIAWSARTALDNLVLTYLCSRTFPASKRVVVQSLSWAVFGAIVIFVAAISTFIEMKVFIVLVCVLYCVIVAAQSLHTVRAPAAHIA